MKMPKKRYEILLMEKILQKLILVANFSHQLQFFLQAPTSLTHMECDLLYTTITSVHCHQGSLVHMESDHLNTWMGRTL